MYTEKEHNDSYLSMSEFVYHACIIGFGVGIIDMLYNWLNVFISEAPFEIIFTSLLDPVVSLIYGIFAGVLTYPLYSVYAKSKGGLCIVLKTKETNN